MLKSKNSAGEMGHRIAKHVLTSAGVLEKSTYYILDAQGNVMSTYERAINDVGSSVSYTQTEKHIYGASRLGVHNERIELLGTQNETYSMTNIQHHIGYKTYELTNHLGNVLSVISDKIVSEEDADAPATQNSVYFDGVNDYGVTASFAAGLGTAISMECWVKTTTYGSTQILGTYYIAGSGIGLDRGAVLLLTSAGKVSMDGRNGTGVYRSSGASTSSVNDGNWHHVAGTVSGGSWKIYVDGTLESSATVTAGNFTGMNQPFYLGRNMIGGFFQGNLREMSVWNYEKTSMQINSDMSTTFTGSETGLVGYWPMTSSGTPGNDVSTANHDATMTNGPVPTTDPLPAVYLADIRQSTDYSPFGVILYKRDYRLTDPATTNLVARGRFGFNGMEMDNEMKQDGNSYDFGARFLDPRIGRWLTIDPRSSKYPSFTPYSFVNNNPTNWIDPDGKDIIVLNAPSGASGAGHGAVLIGNDIDGWMLYSKNGVGEHTSANLKGSSGPSVNGAMGVHFKDLKTFANSEHNFHEGKAPYYTEGYRLSSSKEVDSKMIEVCEAQVCKYYDLLESSCIDVCFDALEAGGFHRGNHEVMLSGDDGFGVRYNKESDIPNVAYKDIKDDNPGGTIIKALLVPDEEVVKAVNTLKIRPTIAATKFEPKPVVVGAANGKGYVVRPQVADATSVKPTTVVDFKTVFKAKSTLSIARPVPKKR